MTLKVEKEIIVTENDTAVALKSGDLPVYASPALMAKCEELAKELVLSQLSEGETTVGIEFSLRHLRPTAVGEKVVFTVAFIEQNKAILDFQFQVFAEKQLIADGTHKRAIVNQQKFMTKLK